MNGLIVDCATGNNRLEPLTPDEKIAATMRQFEAAENARIAEMRRKQRQDDLEALKTAEIAQIREILARLLT